MLFLYKKGLKKAKKVFFQNSSNQEFFKRKGIVKDQSDLLPGSGVNIEKFAYMDYPEDGVNNVLFVGRIIREKGVFELAEAAKNLEKRKDLKFTVVGSVEYGSINPFKNLSNVDCVGYQKDVRRFLKDAHALILPSAYHEGMSNVLLEAASSGKVVLASRIPGCSETFDEGKSGFGFESKNAQSLEAALLKFLALSYEEKRAMGIAGRKKMEEQFNRKIVIAKYFEEMNSI